MTWWQDIMASCLERAREVWKDKVEVEPICDELQAQR